MSEFSGKNVKELREAYASIYSQTDENEVISEEEMIEAFAEEFVNEFITYLSEEGLLKEGDVMSEGVRKAWNKGIEKITGFLSGLTGFGQGTTRIPRAQRTQGGPTFTLNPGTTPLSRGTQGERRRQATAAVGGSAATVMAGTPEGQEALRRAGQAVTGATGGAYKGLTTPSGVPYIDPSDRNSSGKSKQTTPVLPDGFELGPNGEVRRKK
jgi:hypothetical protein